MTPSTPPDMHPAPGSFPAAAVIPSGSLRLDLALGMGGWPAGIIAEIYGPECSGKTALCEHLVASAQKQGHDCAYIDADHSLDAAHAQSCGVDLNRLYLCEPVSAEQALWTCERLAGSGALRVIILDSTTALSTEAELSGKLAGLAAIHQQSERLSASLARLATIARRCSTTVLFTSQLRCHPGSRYGAQAASTANLALKLHAAIRLELSPVQLLHVNGRISGFRVQARVKKNQFTNAFHSVMIDIMYNEGVDQVGEIFDLATEYRLIQRRRSSFWIGSLLLGEDRESACRFLRQDSSLLNAMGEVLRQRKLPLSGRVV